LVSAQYRSVLFFCCCYSGSRQLPGGKTAPAQSKSVADAQQHRHPCLTLQRKKHFGSFVTDFAEFVSCLATRNCDVDVFSRHNANYDLHSSRISVDGEAEKFE